MLTRLIGALVYTDPNESGELTLGHALGMPSEDRSRKALSYVGINTPDSISPHSVYLEELVGMHWQRTLSVILDATGVRFFPIS